MLAFRPRRIAAVAAVAHAPALAGVSFRYTGSVLITSLCGIGGAALPCPAD